MRIPLQTLRAGETGDALLRPTQGELLTGYLLQDEALLRAVPGLLTLVVVLRGVADLRGADGHWRLGARHWLLLPRETTPGIRACGASRVLVLAMDPAVLLRLESAHRPLAAARGRIRLACWRGMRGVWRATAGSDQALHLPAGVVEQLVATLMEGAELQGDLCQRTPGRTDARRRQLLSRMLRARLHIEGNLDRVVRITELARLCSFSPWHFTKTFHRLFGETPQAFGVRLRLKHARDLVLGSPLAISEIAAACGFENASSFARAFHERFGECASRLRARAPQPPPGLRRLSS